MAKKPKDKPDAPKVRHEVQVYEYAVNHWRAQCSCGAGSPTYGLEATAWSWAASHRGSS